MSVIGRLKILMSADSAQIVSDLGKARSAVRSAAGAMGGHASDAAKSLTTEMGKFSTQMRGAPGAISAATSAMRLFGEKGSPSVQTVGSALTSILASGFTPLGLAIGAVTAGIGLIATKSTELSALEEAAEKATEKTATLREEIAGLGVQLSLLSEGGRATAIDVSIRRAEQQLSDLRQSRGPDLSRGESREIETTILSLREQIFELERKRDLERDIAAASDARRSAEQRAERARASAARAAADAAAEQKRVVADSIRAWDRLTASQERRRTQLRDMVLQVEALRDPDVDVSLARQSQRVDDVQSRLSKRGLSSLDERDLSEQLEFEREMLRLLEERLRIEDDRADEGERQREQEAAAAAKERAATAAATEAKRVAERRQAAVEKTTTGILKAEGDLAFDLEQLDRTETARRVAEFEQRFAEILEEARAYGIETVKLEELIAARVRRIRDDAAQPGGEGGEEGPSRIDQLRNAIDSGTATEGFRARISLLQEETASWGKLGAQLADTAAYGISGGIAQALEDVARGSKSASQAFKEFAQSFAFDVARMIQQALILRAVTSLFGAASGGGTETASLAATSVPTTSAAFGGTFRVGGFGGLDSQLVAMKLSPGELVRVTDGAGSRSSDDGVKLAVTVRPPAVIADEVMAKSSREARAAVVATALQRSGRRGGRARE